MRRALNKLVGMTLVHVADRSVAVMSFDVRGVRRNESDDTRLPYLSVNCPWRLLDGDRTICLTSLQTNPCEEKTGLNVTYQAFRDLLLQDGFRVKKIGVDRIHDLKLLFENGYELQVVAFDPDASFHWAVKDIPGYGTIYVEGSKPKARR